MKTYLKVNQSIMMFFEIITFIKNQFIFIFETNEWQDYTDS
jgi:hypothetical protein